MEPEQRFATDEACQSSEAWRMERGLWLCSACRKQVSVIRLRQAPTLSREQLHGFIGRAVEPGSAPDPNLQ